MRETATTLHPRDTPGPETTIWLARHAEAHNPAKVLYGRLPRVRLSDEGRRQAQALAAFLAPRPVTAIYSSPMLRARTTAGIIQSRHPALQVRLDRDLLEVRTGWQGEPLDSLSRINWDFYRNRRHPDDETLEAIRDRMLRWVRRVLRRHAGGEVVGVSHGDPIIAVLGGLRDMPMEIEQIRPSIYYPPACVHRLRFDADGCFVDQTLFVPWQQAAA